MGMMYLIVGRSGSGKDHIAKELIKQSGGRLQAVTSYTTRPQRSPDENTHIFIDIADAELIPEEEKMLKGVIGEYEYFVTPDMLQNKQIYVIEPNGLAELLSRNLPDMKYTIISVQAEAFKRKLAAEGRGSDRTLEGKRFDDRTLAEQERFDIFEHLIASRDGVVQFKKQYPNVTDVFTFYNDFNEAKAIAFAKKLVSNPYAMRQKHDNSDRIDR